MTTIQNAKRGTIVTEIMTAITQDRYGTADVLQGAKCRDLLPAAARSCCV